jgi:hypothetical protein
MAEATSKPTASHLSCLAALGILSPAIAAERNG